MFFRIGIANIRRHGKRSALILIAVAISVIVMEFVGGMIAGMREDFIASMLNDNGHVRIRAAGISEALNPYSLDYLIANPDEIISTVAAIDGVEAVESLVTFGALLIGDDKNAAMFGYGIDGATRYFSDVRDGIVDGRWLQGRGEILVSDSTAILLDVAVGDPAVLLVEDSTGAPYYLEYTIVGTFRSESGDFDETAFLIDRGDAQELLYVDNEVREIRVNLPDPDRAAAVAAEITNRLAAIDRDGLETETWRDTSGSMAVFLQMFDVFMYVINVIIVVVAGTVITNAILMNTFEKIREYGMMRAIGLSKRGQFRLIMIEGAAYGVVGSVLGLAIGIPLVVYFSINGIVFGEFMDSFGLGREIYTAFRLDDAVTNGIFGLLVALAGSLYAAVVAIRLQLIETLREAA